MYDFHLERKTANEYLLPLVENLTKKIPSINSGFYTSINVMLKTKRLSLGRLLPGIVPQIRLACRNYRLIP